MNKVLVFDLDDTLYKEIDFVISAFNYITEYLWKRNRVDVSNLAAELVKKKDFLLYDEIISKLEISQHDFTLEKYLELYRFHYPKLDINNNLITMLKDLKENGFILGLITDGRSITQRNKLHSLQITDFFDSIIISEENGFSKPHSFNYQQIEAQYIDSDVFLYIGDNTDKDFNYPLINDKWRSICVLDNGLNIHPQDSEFLIQNQIETIKEITNLRDIL